MSSKARDVKLELPKVVQRLTLASRQLCRKSRLRPAPAQTPPTPLAARWLGSVIDPIDVPSTLVQASKGRQWNQGAPRRLGSAMVHGTPHHYYVLSTMLPFMTVTPSGSSNHPLRPVRPHVGIAFSGQQSDFIFRRRNAIHATGTRFLGPQEIEAPKRPGCCRDDDVRFSCGRNPKAGA